VKPVIGITSSLHNEAVVLPRTYVESIEKAGGLPLVLPMVVEEQLAAEFVAHIDGLLLSGGPDIDPGHFGQDPVPKLGAITPERDLDELVITRLALERGVSILAICRGIQVLNVAAGGTIIQDIATTVESPLKHRQEAPRWHASHRVMLEPDSKLSGLVLPDGGALELMVNSYHHQAVDDPAPGFVVTATAPDGVIEAIENPDYRFVVGVQWHPEGMWQRYSHFLGLFEGLVRAAGGEC